MTKKEFIEKAVKGGLKLSPFEKTLAENWIETILLRPEAWQAVGKVEEWGTVDTTSYSDHETIEEVWTLNFLELPQALIDGKTIEEFLSTL